MARTKFTTVVLCLTWIFFKETKSATYDLYNTKIATSDLRWTKEPRNSWEEVSGFDKHGNVIRSYQVCQLSRSVKNNWVRSPFIKTRGAQRINIEIEFSIAKCDWPGVDTDYCRQTFNLFYYESDKDVATSTFPPWQERPYIKIDTVAANSNDDINKKTFTIDSKISTGGIYIAAQDQGACMSLISLRVYYYYCPETTHSLARFSQTLTGQKTASLVTVPGKCVDNAELNGLEPKYYCGINGEWQIITGSCRCVAGHQPNEYKTACLPCAAGTYKINAGNGKCIKCPKNSGLFDEKLVKAHNDDNILFKISPFKQAGRCRCHPGFARAIGEGTNIPCTKIPSAPIFTVKNVTSTSVSLRWEEPTDLGGRYDLYYGVTCEYCSSSDRSSCQACPDKVRYSSDDLTRVDDAFPLSTLTKYSKNRINILNLEPFTNYIFKVFSHNGVSGVSLLKPNFLTLEAVTTESVPSPVTNIYIADTSYDSVVINWRSPSNPGGIILGYEVEIRMKNNPPKMERSNEISKKDVNEAGRHVLLTTKTTGTLSNLESDSEYVVRIRAKTSVGFGRYSSSVVFTTPESDKVTKGKSQNGGGISLLVGTISAVLLLGIVCAIVVSLYSRRKTSRCVLNKNTKANTKSYGNDRYDEVVERVQKHATKRRNDPIKNGHSAYVEHPDPKRAVQRMNKEISPLNLRLNNTIGEGEFAVVYRAAMIENGEMKTVAAKQLKEGASSKDQSNFLKEACTMAQFDHPNILKLKGVITEHKPEMIISELVENGSLSEFLQRHRGELSITQLLHMLRGIAHGMQYLSEMQFVHRDLAARNILVNSDLDCKVSDFGLSRTLENHPYGTYRTQGGKIALRWTAPECIRLREFTSASDVWSYGIVMWEVMSYGEKPYWNMTNDDVMQSINSGLRLPAPTNCPKSIHQLMLECWSLDPTRRPTFSKIVSDLNKLIRHSYLLRVKSEEQMEQSVCYSPDRRQETFDKPDDDFCSNDHEMSHQDDAVSEISDSSSVSQDGTCSSVVVNDERCLSI